MGVYIYYDGMQFIDVSDWVYVIHAYNIYYDDVCFVDVDECGLMYIIDEYDIL